MAKIDAAIVSWRAWYTGGRVFESTTTRWEDLPAEGALIFVLFRRTRPYRRMMLGVSLYWHIGDIYACDNAADALIPEGASVKKGKWVTDVEFRAASEEATAAWEAPNELERIDRG